MYIMAYHFREISIVTREQNHFFVEIVDVRQCRKFYQITISQLSTLVLNILSDKWHNIFHERIIA